MYLHFIKLGIFLFLVTTTSSESANSVLLKFRTDVNKVGKDLENLIFHVVQKVVEDISEYQVNGDYNNEEDVMEKTTTQRTVTKNILEDALENTTEDYTTRKTTIPSQKEKYYQNRLKRSSGNSTDLLEHSEATIINKTCTTNSSDQHSVEFQHIDDLKEEIKKLQDLVVLLRDQQKMISILDNTKHFDKDITSNVDDINLLKVLKYVNSKDFHTEDGKNSTVNRTKSIHHHRTSSEELATIKEDLKQAIEALNNTRTGLTMEQRKERLLERELSDQKVDLTFLKLVVEKLLKNNFNFDKNKDDDILGAVQHIPKELPSHNLGKTIEKGLEVHRILGKPNPNIPSARSSDLDDLEQLLHKLNRPKDTQDLESRMFELKRDKEKQKQDNDVMRQLEFLKKYFELQRKYHVVTPEMLKMLLRSFRASNTKGRDLDEGIETELQKLQEAIDALNQNDQVESNDEFNIDEDENEKELLKKMTEMIMQQNAKEEDTSSLFQRMLKKMMHEEKKKEDTSKQFEVLMEKINTQNRKGMGNSVETTGNNVLLKEIIGLRKQLASFEKQNSYFGQGYDNIPIQSEDLANLYQNYNNYKQQMYQKNPYQSSYSSNKDFGGNLEHQNIPFTISVPPNSFWMQTYPNLINSEPTTHFQMPSNGQDAFQTDRNQFFPAPHIFYPKSSSEPFHTANAAFGVGTNEPGDHTQQTGEDAGYIYQKVQDLKTQIYNLQNIIDGFNKPNYTQTPQDRETVASLEKQINELKSIINGMNPDTAPNHSSTTSEVDPNSIVPNYPTKSGRRRRTVDQDAHLFDQAVLGLKNLIFQKENVAESKNNYDDIQRRINNLKYQLEHHLHVKKKPHFSSFPTTNKYQPIYYQHNNFRDSQQTLPSFQVIKSKKNDLFTSVVLKILDKVLAATPAVLERLFEYGFSDLNYSEVNSGYNDQNQVQKMFKSLGFFGYGPLILLKLIDGFSAFVKILKKNEFFRNFLLPVSVVLVVAGAVAFLVWCLKSSDSYTDIPRIDYYNPYNYQFNPGYANYGKGYGNNDYNYGYGGSNKRPVYGTSYFEDSRQRNSLY